MYYNGTNVVNFGKFAKIRVNEIKVEENAVYYYYDTNGVADLRNILDSYFIMMNRNGWHTDFVYPVCVATKENETFTTRYFKRDNTLIFIVGKEK